MSVKAYHARYPTIGRRPTLLEYRHWLRRQERLTPAVQEALERAEGIFVRGEKRVVCYIAGALTEASEEDKMRYEHVSRLCETHEIFGYAPHLYGTDPRKHPNVLPSEVRDVDFLWAVVLADFHVNFLAPVAHGPAIEEGWGECGHIPAIFCAPEVVRVSRLPKGMLNIDLMLLYRDIGDCYEKLEKLFRQLRAWCTRHGNSEKLHFFAERSKERGELVLFNPTRSVEDFLALVADRRHPRYGQVGHLTAHDWKEYGLLYVLFPSGQEETFSDGICDNSPCPLVLIDQSTLASRFERDGSFTVI